MRISTAVLTPSADLDAIYGKLKAITPAVASSLGLRPGSLPILTLDLWPTGHVRCRVDGSDEAYDEAMMAAMDIN